MKRFIGLFSLLLLLVNLTGCGDNKTKEKLYGTQVVTSSTFSDNTPAGYSSNLVTNAATVVTKLGAGIGLMHAPSVVPASAVYGTTPPGMTGPVDGFYNVSTQSSIVYIRFMNAASTTISYDDVVSGSLAKLEVKITTDYRYGAWAGDFFIDKANPDPSSAETITSGKIKATDPIGGDFEADIAYGMTLDMIVLSNGMKMGVPHNGSMTITSAKGDYTGTEKYGVNLAGDHTCDGDIFIGTSTVASVHLKFDKVNANYSGYYTDASGINHDISPQ